MNNITGLLIYLVVGTAGGLLGYRLKVTGGTLIGAMLAVIAFKMLVQKDFDIPKSYTFVIQILIGIMVGISYSPDMNKLFAKIAVPVIISTLVLVAAGLGICIALIKTGLLDSSTSYLSTSPGAMVAMISLAAESKANSPVVLAFHFFRIVFIILTAPLIFHFIHYLFGRPPG
ncbi:MAG: AbrB family transcriptional regulator [Deltaproteobacteria bacterium]|nr:AbrB family transcriptional regulator [Deltaproteobacteria bacterium]